MDGQSLFLELHFQNQIPKKRNSWTVGVLHFQGLSVDAFFSSIEVEEGPENRNLDWQLNTLLIPSMAFSLRIAQFAHFQDSKPLEICPNYDKRYTLLARFSFLNVKYLGQKSHWYPKSERIQISQCRRPTRNGTLTCTLWLLLLLLFVRSLIHGRQDTMYDTSNVL